ncbi:MAG: methionyl-tRNA formyltransferase [Hyphomicrobiaceae bacterium]
MTLRVVFMGSPVFSVSTLAEIIGAGHEVVAVYCQPPRPAGRGQAERPQPVHKFAAEAGIPIFTPLNLRGPEAATRMKAHGADVAVVVAYGLLLPQAILDCPRHGCLNLHASLLPRWRGAAPIHRAIMAGDMETGIMVMRMDAGLDTGPVCLAERVAIGPDATTGDLHDDLARRGGDLMVRALAALERGSLEARPQSTEGATYARKIDKSEARIDFSKPARDVHNHIRGLSPSPAAYFDFMTAAGIERIKVLRSQLADGGGAPGTTIDGELTIACGDGAVRLTLLQRAGKKPMAAAELLRGFAVAAGTVLNPDG